MVQINIAGRYGYKLKTKCITNTIRRCYVLLSKVYGSGTRIVVRQGYPNSFKSNRRPITMSKVIRFFILNNIWRDFCDKIM